MLDESRRGTRRVVRWTVPTLVAATMFIGSSQPTQAVAAAHATDVAPSPVPAVEIVAPQWPAGDFSAGPAGLAATPRAAATITLRDPEDGAVVATARPRLRATAVSRAQYRFVISSGATPQEGQVAESGWLTEPAWTVPSAVLADGGRYVWTAQARVDDTVATAEQRTLTVNLRLGTPQPGGPVASDAIGPLTVNLATGNVTTTIATPAVLTGAGPQQVRLSYNSVPAAAANGLEGAYYAGDSATGIADSDAPVARRVEPQVSFFYSGGKSVPAGIDAGGYRVRWQGTVRVPATGTYEFGGLYRAGLRIEVDGRQVLDAWGRPSPDRLTYGSAVRLTAGRAYPIRVDFRAANFPSAVSLWVRSGKRIAPLPGTWLAPQATVLPPGWSASPAPTALVAEPPSAAAAGDDQPTTPQTALRAAPQSLGAGPAVAGQAKAMTAPAKAKAKAKAKAHNGVRPLAAAADAPSLSFVYAGDSRCADKAAPAGYLCAIVIPDGSVSQLHYSGGKLVRLVNPGGEVTDFRYDRAGLLAGMRPPLVMDWIAADPARRDTDAALYQVGYDETGRAEVLRGPEPAGRRTLPAQRPEHSYRYPADATEVRVAGLSPATGWARRITRDVGGRTLTDTDATGRSTLNRWGGDQRISTTDPSGRSTNTVPSATGVDVYGPAPAECFGAGGVPVEPAPAGCTLIPLQSMAFGPATISTVAQSDGLPDVRTQFTTNQFGMPTAQTLDPGGLALSTTFDYDQLGNFLSVGSPTGAATKFEYFGANETAANPCDPDAAPINQRGRLKSNTAPTPATGAARHDLFVYNERGLEAAMSFGTDSFVCAFYDERGRTIQIRIPGNEDGPARVTRFDYQTGGDPLTLSAADTAGTFTMKSDLLGRTAEIVDIYGTRTRSDYDRAGRVVRKTITPPNGPAQVVANRYDDAGRLVEVRHGDRSMARTKFTAGGELASVDYDNGTRLARVGRDTAGRLTELDWQLANGKHVVSKVQRSRAGTVVDESLGGADARPDGPNYRYDAAGRLVESWVAGHHYGYDYVSASAAGCPAGTRADAGRASNLIALTDVMPAGTETTRYCYDGADRLLAATGADEFSDVTYNVAGHTKAYTLNGKRYTLGWDVAERYTANAVNGPDSADVDYGYNAFDQIVSRTTADGERVLYGVNPADPNALVTYDRDRRVLSTTLRLPGGVMAGLPGGTGGRTWSHINVHGDVALVTNGSGAQVGDLYRYTPYGSPLTPDGRVDPDHVPDNQPGDYSFAWLGQYQRRFEHAGALSSVVLELRPMDTRLSRLLAMGTVDNNPMDINYLYAGGDPVNTVDILGFYPHPNTLDLSGLANPLM
jgi:YD repeat-containing protein